MATTSMPDGAPVGTNPCAGLSDLGLGWPNDDSVTDTRPSSPDTTAPAPQTGPGLRSPCIIAVPVAGEAVDSWLDRCAAAMGIDLVSLVACVSPQRDGHRVMIDVGHGDLGDLATQADHGPIRVRDCLRSLQQSWTTSRAAPYRTQSSAETGPAPWVLMRHSRCCPECLREDQGAWQLSWRWATSGVCVRHRLLLSDTCDLCNLPHRYDATGRGVSAWGGLVPIPGTCANPRWVSGGRVRCGRDLRRLAPESAAGWPELLAAQARVDLMVERALQSSRTAAAWIDDLQSTVAYVLRWGEVGDLGPIPARAELEFAEWAADRGGHGPVVGAPRSSAVAAAVLALAILLVDAVDPSVVDILARLARRQSGSFGEAG